MAKFLGIDTSNYTTSAAVVEDNKILFDGRKILNVKTGERGLRQSEALFQHVLNLPPLLNNEHVRGIDGVCASVRPRPQEGSYMPVFKAGESIAESISYALNVPLVKTTHQDGHIEAACRSINFDYPEFYAFHLSGGTSELLKVKRDIDAGENKIEITGGTKDISFGQFIDRMGVAMGLPFPAGKHVDSMAQNSGKTDLRIPSSVSELYFNLSGQETFGLNSIKKGYNHEEVAFAVMQCVAKTLEKVFTNLYKSNNIPILLIGGVASSDFLRNYFKNKFKNLLYFSDSRYASDNAVGVAFIGLKNRGRFYGK